MDSVPNVTVHLPPALRTRTGGARTTVVQGRTVRDLIDALERSYPGLRYNLCHETGEIRPFVNVFLGREEIRYLQGLDTPVEPGAQVHIIHSVAGG